MVNLDDHITPDARAELTSARQAVQTEMEWDARTLAELTTVTVYIIVKLWGLNCVMTRGMKGRDLNEEETAKFGEDLLDRYMEILSERSMFELTAPCATDAHKHQDKARG